MEKSEYRLLAELEDSYWWHNGLRSIAWQIIGNDMWSVPENAKVLDAGCGTGGWLKGLKKEFWASGLDISEDALYFCREAGLKRLVLGNVTNLPYRDSSFDLITAFDVLEHQSVSSEKIALNEFYRVLKPQGRLLFNVPAYGFMRSYRDKLVHSGKRYTASEVKRILRHTDFRILRITYWNTLLFPLAFSLLFMKNRKSGSLPRFPKAINALMAKILKTESLILKHMNLLYGLSIFCLARKD